MARFAPESEADKQALKERALKLKPKYVNNVVATDKGWANPRPSGYLELLVSFAGLDALLGDVAEDQDISAEPIEVKADIVDSNEQTHEESAESEQQEEVVEETAQAKKKGGRPKKVVEIKPEEKDSE